ncbi:unnamed protein product [Prorocentrum cordatum]|uniref:TRAF3-interacting protein 1 N-terminal domain-containing protein n=1 Tax=Prorocentrum cordatum TaxID=2364126 RepID=A0ABN9V3T3_9DINO|nr:unnamed protein product [Polarella glacialis]
MPCTSEWTQTRDLLQLSLSEMADKLPTAEKIFRRPPVRLIHDIGVVMAQERDCFAPWKVPPELLEFGGLSRDQKVAFFQELIDRTNQVGLGGAGMDELKVTPQDILKGNNCEETNRLLQVLAYLGLRAQRLSAGLGSGGGLLDLAPQWIETWRLRVFTEEGGWQWYGADQEAGGAHVFGGASDAAGTHFVGLPAAVPARRIRVHPVTWHGHAALRCEVHVVLKEGTGSAGAAPAGPGHVRNPSELKGWTSITCDAIVEVQKSIEESRQKKQLEEDEKAAAVLGQKDAAEQERNQLAEQLKSAQQRYEELEAQRLASEQRAVAAETALLQMQVERDRLQSRTEQLETEIVETNEAKRAMDEQCEGLKEQCGELRAEKADLETQLQVMTEERDVARAKEEEYFEYCNSKDEELVDTNNGYVYLTERLQEKEEEMEQLTEEVRKLQEGNEELHDRVQKLASENLDNLGEQQKLRTKLAEEERGHKAAQERYMKLLKSNMGSGDERNSPMTASTDATKVSEDSRGPAEGEKLYEDDFEAE